ncbi:hypothetical protein I0C86_25655 [Plantactinospora sp. S1510]|uniref:Uncharacterized protein n=1 Tax=Plantactinospora alkalitolerans TaxID=2789879 RepID=A0ABS0H1H9_9ACTN|nr:hypothetical protein [Plantactinospora alkalitolerans]MBF9132307.1 hypothetical protein [Plantactinospora alkalitolerans]
MGTDHHHLYGDAVAHRLEPGEAMLACSEAKRPHGLAPDPPPRPPEPAPGDGAKVAGMGLAGAALSGIEFIDNLGGGGPTDWLIRLFFGRAARGRLDSVAAGYVRAVPTDDKLLVVVTDRRLMVLRVGRSNEVRPFGEPRKPVVAAKLKPLWSVHRAEITGARQRWHRLHGARLRVMFRDGSWLEVTGPLCMGRRRAGELRDALCG